ncbi:unnamed protein product [Spirodela intermedia]|uniref:Phytocyanin domain-containing protein n=1 Tax=Spirodela intermedia TaxID=51605 RepID=A0A7I8IJ94_SPIIN|nr:unnamed protein product [Spirodela intermedia]CAA6657034.1 unnamed protein product [Spirodela intermedia]
MERRSLPFSCMFLALACLVLLQSVHGAEGYRNYTVGDSLGWYDKLKEPKVDYKKWVAGKNFSLGDFLIFNTDKNHSVVQTYNATTYQRCDYKNAEDDTVGMNYFFSGLYAGAQCRHGQRFKINVTHGHGLPESLRNPPPAAEAPPPDDGGVPETTVPTTSATRSQCRRVWPPAAGGATPRLTLQGFSPPSSYWYIWGGKP